MRTYSTDELQKLFQVNGFAVKHSRTISFGLDIMKREISRTVVFATKTTEGRSIEVREPVPEMNATMFDAIVHRTIAPCDPHTAEPPVVPRFRSQFGGFWTDLNNAPSILAGKLATGEITPSKRIS